MDLLPNFASFECNCGAIFLAVACRTSSIGEMPELPFQVPGTCKLVVRVGILIVCCIQGYNGRIIGSGGVLIINFCCGKDVDSFITGEVPNVFVFWF